MGLFKGSLFKKRKQVSTEDAQRPQQENGLNATAQVMRIVTAGVESENFSDMTQQLEAVASSTDAQEEYVFGYLHIRGASATTIICVALLLISIYFLFIGIATTLLSIEHFAIGIVIAAISLGLILINAYFAVKSISARRFRARFKIYQNPLAVKRLAFVQDIAHFSKQKESIVIKDLRKAVQQKLIPQGHFSQNHDVFMVSDAFFNTYEQGASAYDQYFQAYIDAQEETTTHAQISSQLIALSENYMQKLNELKRTCKKKALTKNLERLQGIVCMVTYDMNRNAECSNLLEDYLHDFIPATEKLLEFYLSLLKKNISVPHPSAAKKDIEAALEVVTRIFEAILRQIYAQMQDAVADHIAEMPLATP